MNLGESLAKTSLESGKYCWTMLTEQHVKEVVKNVEEIFVEMRHAALEQIYTLSGGISVADGGWCT